MKEKNKLEEWVDVCSGKMTLVELNHEIINYMLNYHVVNMRVEIKRSDDGYRSTIYIPKKEWKLRRPKNLSPYDLEGVHKKLR